VEEEAKQLARHKLLGVGGGDFTMVWDDCNTTRWVHPRTPMDLKKNRTREHVGYVVVNSLAQRIAAAVRRSATSAAPRQLCLATFLIGGWIGAAEPLHEVCLLTTLDLAPLTAAPPDSRRGGLGGHACVPM
jgi:hypothetical protein